MKKTCYSTFIYTALACEAKPLIDHYRLKKNLSIDVFAVYSQNDICLTVTGVGKSAMAAGVAYTQAFFATGSPGILLNVGIAGHTNYSLGQIFLIDKISDIDTGRNYYPPLVFKTLCPTASLQTGSKSIITYDDSCLCDMEAAAFYDTASRFSTGELIQCLKIISDNPSSPAENIQPQQVSRLIAAHIPSIESVLAELRLLAQIITTPAESELLEKWLESYHFTASEQGQLKNQLARWQVLSDNQVLDVSEMPSDNGKAVLRWLEQKISTLAVSL